MPQNTPQHTVSPQILRRVRRCASWGTAMLATLAVSSACTGAGPLDGEPEVPFRDVAERVVDHAAWERVDGREGPFADFIGATCDAGGAVYEEPVFEINTDLCNGGTFTQPSLTPMYRTELFHVVLWHLQLIAPEPAEATIAIAFGNEIVFSQTTPVPGDERVYKPYLRLDESYDEGIPVSIHVRNHGENSYKFLDFKVGADEAFPNFEGDVE